MHWYVNAMYSCAFACNGMYWFTQKGVAPASKKDSDQYPFVALKYDLKMQRLHSMLGNISRVDFERHNAETNKPRCNWFDPEEKFMERADKLPTYGRSYFTMFMKVMKAWAHNGKRIRRCKTPDMVDEICAEKINMWVIATFAKDC